MLRTPRSVTAALLFAVVFSMGLGMLVGHKSTEGTVCPPAQVTSITQP